jgi:rRNA maturation endonuclease Nob1
MRRDELAGLRDAYSGEPLDPARPLVRCEGCRSVYHADSAGVLARDNGGRCVACGGTEFAAVAVVGR